jgi:hypothetical protein
LKPKKPHPFVRLWLQLSHPQPHHTSPPCRCGSCPDQDPDAMRRPLWADQHHRCTRYLDRLQRHCALSDRIYAGPSWHQSERPNTIYQITAGTRAGQPRSGIASGHMPQRAPPTNFQGLDRSHVRLASQNEGIGEAVPDARHPPSRARPIGCCFLLSNYPRVLPSGLARVNPRPL